jgi:hypothetical protein
MGSTQGGSMVTVGSSLLQNANGAGSPVDYQFLPDDSVLFLTDAGNGTGTLQVVSLIDGGAATRAIAPANQFLVSPEGSHVAVWSYDPNQVQIGLTVLPIQGSADGGVSLDTNADYFNGLVFSRDGSHVAYLFQPNQSSGEDATFRSGSLHLAATAGGAQTPVSSSVYAPGGFQFTPDGQALVFVSNWFAPDSFSVGGELEVVSIASGSVVVLDPMVIVPKYFPTQNSWVPEDMVTLGNAIATLQPLPSSSFYENVQADFQAGLYLTPLP